MSPTRLTFYFDFISPYAYFSWLKLDAFCTEHGLELCVQPVVFGKLLDHWGQLGPAEIPPKREWLLKYCYRYAKLHGFELKGPKFHPFNSLLALRMSLSDVAGTNQHAVISAIFEAGWSKGCDIGDESVLVNILNEAGLNGEELASLARKDSSKLSLKNGTAGGIQCGVFGVPTMVIDGELFWGNDQFEHMAMHCSQGAGIDSGVIREALSRERGIDRKTFKNRKADC